MKDYITIITAIIGAVLGVINLILNIYKRVKENIKIYNDDLHIYYQFNFLENCYKENYWIIPLKMDYVLYVLNNKNRVVFIESILWDFPEKNEKYYFKTFYRTKSLNFFMDNYSTKKIEDYVEVEFCINKNFLDNDAHYYFSLPSILNLLIDGKIYKKNVTITLNIDYIK